MHGKVLVAGDVQHTRSPEIDGPTFISIILRFVTPMVKASGVRRSMLAVGHEEPLIEAADYLAYPSGVYIYQLHRRH